MTRLSKAAVSAIKAREVRVFIHRNPGSTFVQIHAAVSDAGPAMYVLHRRRFIRFEGGGKKGPTRWFSVPQ